MGIKSLSPKKIVIIGIIASVLLTLSPPMVIGQKTQTVFGYIRYSNDTPVPINVAVNLTNTRNSNSTTVYTKLNQSGYPGFYITEVFLIPGTENGDNIRVNVSYDGCAGNNSFIINTDLPSQQCDVKIYSPNAPSNPVVSDIPDQTIAEGEAFATITLDDYVVDVEDPDSAITWTYNGNTDLTVDITDRVATITTPDPDWNGAETITFTAEDTGGLTDSDDATFTVTTVNDPPSPNGGGGRENTPPIANINLTSLEYYVGNTIIFDGSESYDPDGYIAGYRWDFNNDGLFTDWDEELSTSHIYSRSGNYTVKLQVKDNDDAVSMDSYVITIIALESDQQLPVAQINGPYKGFLHEDISFNGTGSYDPDGIIVKYEWKFGDGNVGDGVNPRHKYNQVGEYIVLFAVTDDDGLTDIVATKATIISLIKEVDINNITHYLVDTSGDNYIDAFYNSITNEIIVTNKIDDGLYLIDENGDRYWDYIYDIETEKLSLYAPERTYPLELPISIGIALAVTIVVVIILRKRRYYFLNEKREKSYDKKDDQRADITNQECTNKHSISDIENFIDNLDEKEGKLEL